MKDEDCSELLSSVKEMDEILRGNVKACRVRTFQEPEARAVREKTGLSQRQFAVLIGVSKRTLENWEQGRRKPTGPARALLKVFDADPIQVVRALRS